MVDGGIGQDALQIILGKGSAGGKDNGDYRKPEQRCKSPAHLLRKNGQQDAEESIHAHFGHDTGKEHGSARRRFGVRRRKPSVKWKERNFDRESEKGAGKNY